MGNVDTNKINQTLAERYGCELDGKPRFRIAWSESLFESRRGEFNVYYGHIYLRTEIGVRKVRKYNYIHERWILERLSCGNRNNELVEPDNYEPVYVFESGDGRYLPPIIEACDFVIKALINPVSPQELKDYYEKLDLKEQEKEIEYFKDTMGNGYIADRLHDNDGIIINPYEGDKNVVK